MRGRARSGPTGVALDVRLPADLPAKYETAVVRAAERCSVKQALADPPEIRLAVRR